MKYVSRGWKPRNPSANINKQLSLVVNRHGQRNTIIQKGTSRQRSGKCAIRKRFQLQKPRWEKTKLTIRYLYHETIVSRMGSYFRNRWPLSHPNLTKNMKTYIRRQQHKKFLKHQDIKQKEPPQKYRLGTISNTKLLAGLNRFYMAITSPSASAVVHNI